MPKLPKIENHIAIGNDDSEETSPFIENEVTTFTCISCGIEAEIEDVVSNNLGEVICPECFCNQ
jgi:hypothetical protein